MKKLISIILSIILLLSVVALFPANAATITINTDKSCSYKGCTFYYQITEDGYIEITGINNVSPNTVEFPSEINGYTVKYIGENLFANVEDWPSNIIIPDTVTHICVNAFWYTGGIYDGAEDISDLKTVKLSKNLEYIGRGAFYNHQKLENLEIPESVTYIGDSAFYGCEKIDITIPKSILYIGSYAFSNCDSLTKVTIPGTIWNIGRAAFYSCDNLKKVVLKQGIKIIPYEAFESCISLKKVRIPNGVDYVENRAFYNCQKLKTVTIQESTKTRKDSFGFYVNKKGVEKVNKNLKVKVLANHGSFSTISNDLIIKANKLNLKSVYVMDDDSWLSKLSCSVGTSTKLNVADKTVTKWKSSNPKVAKITKKGKLTTLSKGETEITMTLKDGTTYTRKLKVQ